MSDFEILELLRARVGKAFRFEMEGERCVELDLTSADDLYHGLIRHHSAEQKREILELVCRLPFLRRDRKSVV